MVPTAPQCPAGLARTFYSKSEEEKLNQNRELLPQLREAVQEDTHVLGRVRKVPAGPICCLRDCGSAGAAEPASPLVLSGSRKSRAAGEQEAGTIPRLAVMCSLFFCPQHELTLSEACGAEQPLGNALASKTVEVIAESSGRRLLSAGWASGDAQKNRL